jgi:site-specific DNA-methyltransferase (adenine-specific)
MVPETGSALEQPLADHIYVADCLHVMSGWPDGCVDHCIADPPFNISGGDGRRGNRKGLGWAFSSHVTMQERWDRFSKEEFYDFNRAWLSEVCRLVKPNGNILVFGTFHNIYQLGFILQNVLDRRVNNSIVWFKPNAQPNITARTLTESTEHIIWAVNNTQRTATKWTFDYRAAKEIGAGRQLRNMWPIGDGANVWEVPLAPPSEGRHGRHPAQKPLDLTDRLVDLFTLEGEVVLDPFAGTGAVAVSALSKRRRYILIESARKYVAIAEKRVQDLKASRRWQLLTWKGGGVVKELTPDETVVLEKVPVPQADDLELVFQVPRWVRQGANTRLKIAEKLGYDARQGTYYADAAIALGLIRTVGKKGGGEQDLEITQAGWEIASARESELPRLKRRVVAQAPHIRFLAGRLGVDPSGIELGAAPPLALLDERKVASALRHLVPSEKTALRRAQTLIQWLRSV